MATLSVLLAFLVILFSGVYIAWNAADTFGMLIASGITFLIGLQVLINVGVVTGTLPTKVSRFPSSVMEAPTSSVMLACIGLLINVGRQAAAHVSLPARRDEVDDLAAPELA